MSHSLGELRTRKCLRFGTIRVGRNFLLER
jgi:hypothetical protein